MFGWNDFKEDEKNKRKIGEKMGGRVFWLRGGGGEKYGRA